MCAFIESLGERSYHGNQAYRNIYARQLLDFDRFTELSVTLRTRLSAAARITLPEVQSFQDSTDGTRKYLFRLTDGQLIESVLIPEPNRDTLCISTQVGCSMDCQFCLTALIGFARNLTAGEIVGQILATLKGRTERKKATPVIPSKPINVVLMGMGEPLLNYDNVVKALNLMTDPRGMGLSAHRITLSTVGVVPKILQLAKAPVLPNLAVSLSATTDEVRNRLIPINKRFPIRALLDACAQFPLRPRQRMTFEYVMIQDVNDTAGDATRLVKLLSTLRAKVNLLPLNPGNNHNMLPSSAERIERFQQILASKGLPAYIRRPRGADIFAACGQLHRAQTHIRVLP